VADHTLARIAGQRQRGEPPLAGAAKEIGHARGLHALSQQQGVQALLARGAHAHQAGPIPTQLPQVSNRDRRVVHADHTVPAQRIGQPPRIPPVGFGGVARFAPCLPRIDDDQIVADQVIRKRPGGPTGFHCDATPRAAPREARRNPLPRVGNAILPEPRPVRSHGRDLKEGLVQIDADILLHRAVLLSGPEHVLSENILTPVEWGDGPFI
jgi:hypothetical protein